MGTQVAEISPFVCQLCVLSLTIDLIQLRWRRFRPRRWWWTNGALRRLKIGPAKLPRPFPLQNGEAESPNPGVKKLCPVGPNSGLSEFRINRSRWIDANHSRHCDL